MKTTTKTLKATEKTVKKSAQYKAAKNAAKTVAKKTSARTRAAIFLGVGATTAAGTYLVKRGGGGEDENPARVGNADLGDPAVAAGV